MRFVFLTLENAVKDGSLHDCYPDFVKKKINLEEGNYTIITFNYETLLERALLNCSLSGNFSYGLDVDANRIEHFPSYERNFDESLLILKLHGSLNWAECQNCNKNQLFWFNQYDHIFKEKCNKCDKNLTPILIPPTKSKYLKEPLANLWKIAEDKIIRADEITIIGYSFNDYDVTALSLILDSIKQNKQHLTLNIIDSDPHNIRNKIFSLASIDENDFKEIHLFKGFRNYLKEISIQ